MADYQSAVHLNAMSVAKTKPEGVSMQEWINQLKSGADTAQSTFWKEMYEESERQRWIFMEENKQLKGNIVAQAFIDSLERPQEEASQDGKFPGSLIRVQHNPDGSHTMTTELQKHRHNTSHQAMTSQNDVAYIHLMRTAEHLNNHVKDPTKPNSIVVGMLTATFNSLNKVLYTIKNEGTLLKTTSGANSTRINEMVNTISNVFNICVKAAPATSEPPARRLSTPEYEPGATSPAISPRRFISPEPTTPHRPSSPVYSPAQLDYQFSSFFGCVLAELHEACVLETADFRNAQIATAYAVVPKLDPNDKKHVVSRSLAAIALNLLFAPSLYLEQECHRNAIGSMIYYLVSGIGRLIREDFFDSPPKSDVAKELEGGHLVRILEAAMSPGILQQRSLVVQVFEISHKSVDPMQILRDTLNQTSFGDESVKFAWSLKKPVAVAVRPSVEEIGVSFSDKAWYLLGGGLLTPARV